METRRSGRIEIDPEQESIEIPGPVLTELYGHAVEAYPEECCGLITGDHRVRYQHVHRCRNEMTRHHQQDPVNFPRDGSKAFYMAEADYLRVMKEAEASGQRVSGVYHSHVDAGAYFSELDQDFASQRLFPFPDAAHIVLSVVERAVKQAGLFRYLHEESRFDGRSIRTPGT